MTAGVRIAGGDWRGRVLRVPRGARPTPGRVREALFAIWGERVSGAVVLDLFSAAGTVALEALSRGAARVVCIDSSAPALQQLRRNVEDLDADARVLIRRAELPEGLAGLAAGLGRFDLVFADPPYAFDRYPQLLRQAAPLLHVDGSLAIEHAARLEVPRCEEILRCDDRRIYGESAISFYRVASGPAGHGSGD